MTTGDPRIPDRAVLTGPAWVAQVESNSLVDKRLSWAFAPHAGAAPPNMQVFLKAGALLVGQTITELALQNTTNFTAPTVDPRIDRVVIDSITGLVERVTGAEAASPVPPAVPAGKFPIAQVSLTTSITEITNDDIVDERIFGLFISPLSLFFESTEQTVTQGRSVAHGLGAVPKLATVSFRCVSGNAGYAVDDEVDMAQWQTQADTNESLALWKNATLIGISYQGTPIFANKGGGGQTTIATNSWRLVFRAWL